MTSGIVNIAEHPSYSQKSVSLSLFTYIPEYTSLPEYANIPDYTNVLPVLATKNTFQPAKRRKIET